VSSVRELDDQSSRHGVRVADALGAFAAPFGFGGLAGDARLLEHPPVDPARGHAPERFQVATELHERQLGRRLRQPLATERP
jgi:hypothetical protein